MSSKLCDYRISESLAKLSYGAWGGDIASQQDSKDSRHSFVLPLRLCNELTLILLAVISAHMSKHHLFSFGYLQTSNEAESSF